MEISLIQNINIELQETKKVYYITITFINNKLKKKKKNNTIGIL